MRKLLLLSFAVLCSCSKPTITAEDLANQATEAAENSHADSFDVRVDAATGCEYIRYTGYDGISIRYDSSGKPRCPSREEAVPILPEPFVPGNLKSN